MTPLRVVVIAILAVIPGSSAYNFLGFNERAPPLVSSLDLAEPILLDGNSNRLNLHENPTYAVLQRYLHSLEAKPSCHRTATALVADCKKLDTSDGASVELRYRYAAQLSVCEFEAMEIWYPEECKSLGSSKRSYSRCIKKLETRSQWWTTFNSNNQHAMMVCAAVRHDIEQAKLLELYQNVTTVQVQLVEVMGNSVDEVSRIQAEQKSFAGSWKSFLSRLRGDVEVLQDGVFEQVRMGGTKLERVLSGLLDKIMDAQAQSTATLEKMTEKLTEKMNGAFHRAEEANDASIVLFEKVRHHWEETDLVMSKASEDHRREFERTMDQIDQINILASSASDSVRAIQDTTNDISAALFRAAADVQDLSALRYIKEELMQQHEEWIARSEKATEARLAARELAQERAFTTAMDSLKSQSQEMAAILQRNVDKIDMVGRSLEDADYRIQGLGSNGQSLGMGIMVLALVLCCGHENWRAIVAAVLFFLGVFMWCNGSAQLHQLQSSWKRDLAVRAVNDPTSTLLVKDAVLVSVAVLLFVAVLVGAIFWKRKRGDEQKQMERLP